jgi:hypothetical protein
MNDNGGCPDNDPDCLCHGIVDCCAWCGKKSRGGPLRAMVSWCNDKCVEEHRVANPTADHFVGWTPIEDTLPGGPLDGIWEDSGFNLQREP